MRSDLNKLLCERERFGHRASYGDVRHVRNDDIFDKHGEFVGKQRESMTTRHNRGWRRKHFNENLNPLYGWVRKNVNRPWNKAYSELCQTFNMDSVINQHILTHLFDFVETQTKLDENGKVYIHGWGGEWKRTHDSYSEFYVHPKTGILTYNKHRFDWRAAQRKLSEQRRKEEAAKTVWINDLQCAVFENGQWYENRYDYQVVTALEKEVVAPDGSVVVIDSFIPKYPNRYGSFSGFDRWGKPIHGAKVFLGRRQLHKREMRRYGLIKK